LRFQVYDARRQLSETYQLRLTGISAVDLVKRLIARAVDNLKRVDASDNADLVTQALVLMTKWSDFKWTHNNIIARLLDVLKENPGDMRQLVWVVKTLGLVGRE
jgi:hypothetical protein